MTAILSYDLKKCMKLLFADNRWNVLTVLVLHANIRNRCYVGMDTVAQLATNGNLKKATRAKKWLEAHYAYVPVEFDKRVDDELKLAPRQHVYQLTGLLKPCGDPECLCHQFLASELAYLHFGKADIFKGENNEVFPNVFNAENIELPPNVVDGENFIVVPVENGSKDIKDIVVLPKEGNTTGAAVETPDPPPLGVNPPRPPNAWYDTVKAVWGFTQSYNGEMQKMLQGTSTRNGFKEYNLDPGLTPEDLRAWAAWYRRTELRGDPNLNMLEDRMKIQSSITAWREKRQRIADENERRAKADREFEAANPELYNNPLLRRSTAVHQ